MMTDLPPKEGVSPALDQAGAPVEAVPAPWQPEPYLAPVLTVDARLMRDTAARALAAGRAGLTKVGVASVQHGDGATTIARSLATCLSENFGKRVILVEGNHRSPCLRRLCGLPPGCGFFDVLNGAASLEGSLRLSRTSGRMLVLPASEGGFLMGSRLGAAFETMLAELLFYAEAIIVDLPPLLRYPDAALLGRSLDGVAVVVRAGETTRREGVQAVEALAAEGVKVMGAVLNRVGPA
jgi:receptor protein-tyrosine kinase